MHSELGISHLWITVIIHGLQYTHGRSVFLDRSRLSINQHRLGTTSRTSRKTASSHQDLQTTQIKLREPITELVDKVGTFHFVLLIIGNRILVSLSLT